HPGGPDPQIRCRSPVSCGFVWPAGVAMVLPCASSRLGGRRAATRRARRGSQGRRGGGSLPEAGRMDVKQLITAIVQALVDKPEQVQIKEVIGEHAHVLELSVAKEDLGKVIGKGGAHASAIRTIMAAASGKEKKRYILEIIEHYPPVAGFRSGAPASV